MSTIKPYLVFPPGWTPFAPYLALPALKGYLEHKGIATEIRDFNVDFFDYLFDASFLEKAYQVAVQKFELLDSKSELDDGERDLYSKYIKAILAQKVISQIDQAKQTIRSKIYYEPKMSRKVNHTLFSALQLASSRYEGLNVRFNKIETKYSATSTKEVLLAIEDVQANPFLEYFQERVLPDLKTSGANLFGVSVTSTSQLIPALTLARLVRQNCPQVAHIVFGGNLMTRLAMGWDKPHPFFKLFDFLICYEGEEALHRLIHVLNNGGDLSQVPNLCFIHRGELVKNAPLALPVEELALPNFDGYFTRPYFLPELVLPLYSSKSCFAKCAFCPTYYEKARE